MDFARAHVSEPSAASLAAIRYLPPENDHLAGEKPPLQILTSNSKPSLDDIVLQAANRTATELLLGPKPRTCPRKILDAEGGSLSAVEGGREVTENEGKEDLQSEKAKGEQEQEQEHDKSKDDPDETLTPAQISLINSSLYPDRMIPQTRTIQPGQLVVIFESFDNMNFTYAKPGGVFNNRNGSFHHDDFLGKPFGCHIRSRNNRGYGYCYVLKPTPELWARSLNHRTQIVHELDASMIVYYLHLQPNMVVCESGTGSGALSHCLLRSIAPYGHLFTYEFNKARADTARTEFASNGVGRLVTVRHKDVCGKDEEKKGGFERPAQSVDAVVLDLPEPWLAIPHAAYVLRSNGRIATYSPCVEQSQRAVAALQECGFHSMVTKEFRLREYYVDEYSYEDGPPRKKRQVPPPNPLGLEKPQPQDYDQDDNNADDENERPIAVMDGNDTGAEADNEKSEYETEGDQASLATAEDVEKATTPQMIAPVLSKSLNGTTPASAINRKSILVARPFTMMRGHTAFLTFATAGNIPQPDPNK